MTAKRTIVSLLVAVLLIGVSCATVGSKFPTDPVSGITIGKTTKADIAEMFGAPWRTGVEDGQKTWTYGYYKYSVFGKNVTRDLVVRFDEKGSVASYSYNTSDFEE